MAAPVELKRSKHIKYFQRCLEILPARYTSLDSSRMTVAFFAISGLDMLKAIDVLKADKQKIIDWIYRLQVTPNKDESNLHLCGFRGSTTLSASGELGQEGCDRSGMYDNGHIAMTYTALLSLLILGDDLSKVNRRAILCGLRQLQLADGSFSPTPDRPENDMRFVYCACCVSHVLNDWRAFDKDLACDYILRSQTYEGGFGQGPRLEAHGGSTFCAVASLVLMNRLYDTLSPARIERLKRWCLFRQESGFNGRPNKPIDTCYSFWVGATLKMLNVFHLSDPDANHGYLMDTQDSLVGGFAKWPDNGPDALHSYFGVCGLSLIGGARYSENLRDMNAALNVSSDVYNRLSMLHSDWLQQHSQPRADLNVTKHVEVLLSAIKLELKLLGSELSSTTNDTDNMGTKLQTVASAPAPAAVEHLEQVMHSLAGLQLYGAATDTAVELHQHAVSCCLNILQKYYNLGLASSDHLLNISKPIELGKSDICLLHSCLNILLIGAVDLSLINRAALLNLISLFYKSAKSSDIQSENDSHVQQMNHLQLKQQTSQQLDIETIYGSVCTAYALNDISILNHTVSTYIKPFHVIDGGFRKSEGSLSDEKTTYQALASLILTRRLHATFSEQEIKVIRGWCRQRLQYRLANHSTAAVSRDTLDSIFWSLASLEMLGFFLDSSIIQQCRSVMVSTQSILLSHQSSDKAVTDDSSKRLSDSSTKYRLLCVLSLIQEPGISSINAALGLNSQAITHMRSLHVKWLQNSSQ